jgi:type III secretion protein L
MAIGKVIKGDGSGELAGSADRQMPRPARAGVMNAEIFDARQSAQGIVEEAHKEKERIFAEAQREKEEVLAKAREQGRQEGLAQASEVLLRAKMQAGEMLAGNEKDVIALACKIAEKIIGRDLERQPELLIDMCATAIEQIRSARSMILRVHPKTAQVLRARKPFSGLMRSAY